MDHDPEGGEKPVFFPGSGQTHWAKVSNFKDPPSDFGPCSTVISGNSFGLVQKQWFVYPDALCMVYLPTFGCVLGQMFVNIPYMEHMGYCQRLLNAQNFHIPPYNCINCQCLCKQMLKIHLASSMLGHGHGKSPFSDQIPKMKTSK